MVAGSLGSRIVPLYGGGQCPNPANVIYVTNTPVNNGNNEPAGTIAINKSTGDIWVLTNPNPSPTWTHISGGAVAIETITGDSGGAQSPVAGNFNLKGTANQITVTGTAGTETWSLPSAVIFPGSATTTTTLTATTGIIFVLATASGASPQTANGRVISVTFSGVSIAAAATQAFTISNSAITGSGTICHVTMRGATTGAALSIQSVANTSSQTVITVTNGTGASTTTANITFDIIVLN